MSASERGKAPSSCSVSCPGLILDRGFDYHIARRYWLQQVQEHWQVMTLKHWEWKVACYADIQNISLPLYLDVHICSGKQFLITMNRTDGFLLTGVEQGRWNKVSMHPRLITLSVYEGIQFSTIHFHCCQLW